MAVYGCQWLAIAGGFLRRPPSISANHKSPPAKTGQKMNEESLEFKFLYFAEYGDSTMVRYCSGLCTHHCGNHGQCPLSLEMPFL